MVVNRTYPIVHNDVVISTGTRNLSFAQPESFVDFADGSVNGLRFHLDVHGTKGTFDSWKLKCKFQLGMFDVGGAGFSEIRWYDLQPEQVKTMIMEGIDWYAGDTEPKSYTNLVTNPSWVNSDGGGQNYSDGEGITSRPTDGGYKSPGYRRMLFTKATTEAGASLVSQSQGKFPVKEGRTYSASMRFATNRPQRFHFGIRWSKDATTLTGQDSWNTTETYPATVITQGNRVTVTGVAPEGANSASLVLNSVAGAPEFTWQAGDTLDIDAGLLVESDTIPPDFDGDTAGATWNGVAHASTSTMSVSAVKELGIVASSANSLPVTVSRSIKGYGQLVRVYIRPEFVNGSSDAGIVYSLSAVH